MSRSNPFGTSSGPFASGNISGPRHSCTPASGASSGPTSDPGVGAAANGLAAFGSPSISGFGAPAFGTSAHHGYASEDLVYYVYQEDNRVELVSRSTASSSGTPTPSALGAPPSSPFLGASGQFGSQAQPFGNEDFVQPDFGGACGGHTARRETNFSPRGFTFGSQAQPFGSEGFVQPDFFGGACWPHTARISTNFDPGFGDSYTSITERDAAFCPPRFAFGSQTTDNICSTNDSSQHCRADSSGSRESSSPDSVCSPLLFPSPAATSASSNTVKTSSASSSVTSKI